MKRFNLKQYLKNGIRRLSYRYPARYEALKRARTPAPKTWPNPRIKWVCKCVACRGVFSLKDVQVDHIKPIIPVSGWPEAPKSRLYNHRGGPDMNVLVYRCFIPPEGYQVLCKPCHRAKTKQENARRKN